MVRDWLMHLVGADRKSKKRRDVLIHESGATSAGCMCAVFHLFDNMHHIQFPLNHHHQQQRPSYSFLDRQEDENTPSKGIEAPRNSLEVEQPKKPSTNASDSNSVAVREERDIKSQIPVGIQNIKTSKHVKVSSSPRTSTKSRLTDGYSSSSDQCNNSPGLTKTPTLVARLMGLDLLPEECCSSPSLSSLSNSKPFKRAHFQKIQRSTLTSFSVDDISVGVRSLPETPRISSARRSDVEYYHHRLSLQVNRENVMNEDKQPKGGRFRILSTQDHHENNVTSSSSSPRHYARQIVKNVRESVSRRVGLTDITNTDRESRRDQNLVLLEPTKKKTTRFNQDLVRFRGEEKENQPRLRLVEATKNKTSTSSGAKSSPRLSAAQGINDVINPLKSKKEMSCAKLCNSSSITGKFRASECATKNKKEEQFVRSNATSCKVNFCNDHHSKFKKTPLLSDALSMKQIKKDIPSPSPTRLPQKQVSNSRDALPSRRSSTRLSRKPSHSYEHSNKLLSSGFPENVPPRDLHRSGPSSTALHGGDVAAECGKYIQLILNRAGITKRANRWHSLKQPADPFIFYDLELFHYGGGGGMLSLRCNRKLIFQLVNELLADIMVHDKICRLGLRHDDEDKVPVLDELCQKINNFPEANCEVLEDIDYLIGTDMSRWESNSYCDVELEGIMCEVEGEMVEHLLKETVVVILEEQKQRQKQRVLRISSAFM